MSIRMSSHGRGFRGLLCALCVLAVPAAASAAIGTGSPLTEADLRIVVSGDLTSGPFLVNDWHRDYSGDTNNGWIDLVWSEFKVRSDDPNTGFNDASAGRVAGMPYFSPPKATGSLEVLIDTNYDMQDDFVIVSQLLDGALVSDVTPIFRLENGSRADTQQVAVWKYRGVYGFVAAFDWQSLNVTSMRVRMKFSDNLGVSDSAPDEYEGALVQLPLAPSAPVDVTALAGDREASVSWALPSQTGTHPIMGFTVTASPGGKTCATTATSCLVSGLVNGQTYTFTVVAHSAAGTSPASDASAPVTLPLAPSAPIGAAAVAGDKSATVTWAPPTQPGTHPIIDYTATATPGATTCTTTTTSCVVPGLTNGLTYTFTVVARSAAGTSAASAPTAPVAPRPFAVAKVQVRRSGSVLYVDINPNKGRGYWLFRLEVLRSNGLWAPLKKYKSVGSRETRTLDLKKGTYRVVVLAKYGYQGSTSVAVTLRK